MLSEEEMWQLDAAYNEIVNEVALNERVFKALEDALGRIAREFYPGLANWHSEQLRKLDDRIVRTAHSFMSELCDLNYEGLQQK